MLIMNLEFEKEHALHYNDGAIINCRAIEVYSDQPFDEFSEKYSNGKYKLFHMETLTSMGELYNVLYDLTQTEERYSNGVDFQLNGLSFAKLEKGDFHLTPNDANIALFRKEYFDQLPLTIHPSQREDGSFYYNDKLNLGASKIGVYSDSETKEKLTSDIIEKITSAMEETLVLDRYKISIDDNPILEIEGQSYKKLKNKVSNSNRLKIK